MKTKATKLYSEYIEAEEEDICHDHWGLRAISSIAFPTVDPTAINPFHFSHVGFAASNPALQFLFGYF